MNEESQQKSEQEEILDAIKAGDIKMRPRWQFVVRGILAVLGGVLIALVLLYLISLIIFTARQTGAAFVPAFGLRGAFAFARALPWLLIIFSLAFIVLLEILVRGYSFAYRRPLIYSACGIIVLSIIGGFVVAGTSLHSRLLARADRQRLPAFAQNFYRFNQQSFRDIHRGLIVSTTTDSFMIRGRMGEVLHVSVASGTQSVGMGAFGMGDLIVVFGPEASGTIQAIGVRRIGQ